MSDDDFEYDGGDADEHGDADDHALASDHEGGNGAEHHDSDSDDEETAAAAVPEYARRAYDDARRRMEEAPSGSTDAKPRRASIRRTPMPTARPAVATRTLLPPPAAPAASAAAAPPSPLPTVCPVLTAKFPRVLSTVVDASRAGEADPRFRKRMKVSNDVCSLTPFIVTTGKKAVPVVTPAAAPVVAPAPPPTGASPFVGGGDEDDDDDDDVGVDDGYCELCNTRKVLCPRTAQSICVSCGLSQTYMVPDTSFREGVSIHTPYLYKRSNHFRDHLKRVQGRESTLIEDEVLEQISKELAKTYRQEDLDTVTPVDIRQILKRLGLSRLYNHATRIWSLTTGGQPLSLTHTQEAELLHMFQMIQGPWERLRPEGRSNMLSYSFLIHKMSRILGYNDVAKHFRLLKSAEKKRYQDEVWAKICEELGFTFERSV
jgi:hypothetical protein